LDNEGLDNEGLDNEGLHGGISVGRNRGSPVSVMCRSPFELTGTVIALTIRVPNPARHRPQPSRTRRRS
ncbi:MAG: hypothetical protein K0U70_07800, partial [Actinomycetia bacterium]|nr:hypothetical protein [Actinomycetes bacterium]